MTLRDRLQADLAQAMRARDDVRKSALRMLISAVRNAEIPSAPAKQIDEADIARIASEARTLDDAAILQVIQKQIKQRHDSTDQFRRAGREDLASREEAEIAVFEAYLPRQASPQELEEAARRVIAEAGATGPRDIGKVMPALTKEFAGRADGRAINAVVRALLGA